MKLFWLFRLFIYVLPKNSLLLKLFFLNLIFLKYTFFIYLKKKTKKIKSGTLLTNCQLLYLINRLDKKTRQDFSFKNYILVIYLHIYKI